MVQISLTSKRTGRASAFMKVSGPNCCLEFPVFEEILLVFIDYFFIFIINFSAEMFTIICLLFTIIDVNICCPQRFYILQGPCPQRFYILQGPVLKMTSSQIFPFQNFYVL